MPDVRGKKEGVEENIFFSTSRLARSRKAMPHVWARGENKMTDKLKRPPTDTPGWARRGHSWLTEYSKELFDWIPILTDEQIKTLEFPRFVADLMVENMSPEFQGVHCQCCKKKTPATHCVHVQSTSTRGDDAVYFVCSYHVGLARRPHSFEKFLEHYRVANHAE